MMRKNRRAPLTAWFTAALASTSLGAGAAGCGQADGAPGAGVTGSEHADGAPGADAVASPAAPEAPEAPEAQVLEVAPDGLPRFVVGDFGLVAAGSGAVAAGPGPDAVPDLARIAPIFRLRAADLRLVRATTDGLGYRHFKYGQQVEGEEVVGAEVAVHVDAKGQIYAVRGNARPGEPSPARALGRAAPARLGAPYEGAAIGAPELVYVLSTRDGVVRRAWSIIAEGELDGAPYRDRVFVDAGSGEVVEVRPQIHAILNRRVHSGGNMVTLPGTLMRSEGQAPSIDATVNANYDLLGAVYNGYLALFGRDSYDGAGAPLISTVHHGRNFVNAFWNGTQMVYGDGDGTHASSLAFSFDVTAHELTHAVTERESGLVYQNESGAINEAMSDVFGAILEANLDGAVGGDTWKVGEDVWTPATPGDALRYLDNPTRDGVSRDYYPERYTGTADNGGVHWNSGIANHAFYLLTVGGKHVRGKTPNVAVPALGIQKAGQIWYRANTTYLGSSSGFQSLRVALRRAALDLYGGDAAAAVDASLDAVGVPGSPPPRPAHRVHGETGDFTGDGYADYADHVLSTGGFYVHENYRDGTFAPWGVGWGSGQTCTGPDCEVLVGDFTGDGYADYADHILSTGGFYVHENYRDGTFAPWGVGWGSGQTCTGSGCEVLVGDFTGDGYADFADRTILTGEFVVHANLRNGTFSTAAWGGGTNCGSLDCETLVGDFTGDGYADYADHSLSTGAFWVHENYRDGTFAPWGVGWGSGQTCTGPGCVVLGYSVR